MTLNRIRVFIVFSFAPTITIWLLLAFGVTPRFLAQSARAAGAGFPCGFGSCAAWHIGFGVNVNSWLRVHVHVARRREVLHQRLKIRRDDFPDLEQILLA